MVGGHDPQRRPREVERRDRLVRASTWWSGVLDQPRRGRPTKRMYWSTLELHGLPPRSPSAARAGPRSSTRAAPGVLRGVPRRASCRGRGARRCARPRESFQRCGSKRWTHRKKRGLLALRRQPGAGDAPASAPWRARVHDLERARHARQELRVHAGGGLEARGRGTRCAGRSRQRPCGSRCAARRARSAGRPVSMLTGDSAPCADRRAGALRRTAPAARQRVEHAWSRADSRSTRMTIGAQRVDRHEDDALVARNAPAGLDLDSQPETFGRVPPARRRRGQVGGEGQSQTSAMPG